MPPIASVIFDCDGVLVDSEPTSNRILARMLSDLGLPMTTEQSMATFMGRSWASNLAIIEEQLGAAPPDDFTERYRGERNVALAEVQPVPGILEAIERIDLPMCVASSGDHVKMTITLGAVGLYDRFGGKIFSAVDLDGRGKPHPDLFLWAAREMNFEPASTAVVEDSGPGVEAGIAAGMQVFGYRVDAPTRFEDMRELPGLLGTA
jgi:HAD superfamily hydrolase (TIGR01509 family)